MFKSWNYVHKHNRAGGGKKNPILGLNQIQSINPKCLFVFEEACTLPCNCSRVEQESAAGKLSLQAFQLVLNIEG